MKLRFYLVILVMLSVIIGCANADGWVIPDNHHNNRNDNSGTSNSADYINVRLIDDLATRSGPSTTYTGCGSYRIKGQSVKAFSRSYDNGGVLWIEIEFPYGGGYRRAWTGAKRLDISAHQLSLLPEEDSRSWIGYGTVNDRISPRYGPGDLYSKYSDRDFSRNDQVLVLCYENGYYQVECYHTDGHIFRSWIPEYCLDLNGSP